MPLVVLNANFKITYTTKPVDHSFDHEFGTRSLSSPEIDTVTPLFRIVINGGELWLDVTCCLDEKWMDDVWEHCEGDLRGT